MSRTASMCGLDLATQAAKRPWKVQKTVLSLLQQNLSHTYYWQHVREEMTDRSLSWTHQCHGAVIISYSLYSSLDNVS